MDRALRVAQSVVSAASLPPPTVGVLASAEGKVKEMYGSGNCAAVVPGVTGGLPTTPDALRMAPLTSPDTTMGLGGAMRPDASRAGPDGHDHAQAGQGSGAAVTPAAGMIFGRMFEHVKKMTRVTRGAKHVRTMANAETTRGTTAVTFYSNACGPHLERDITCPVTVM